MKRRRMLYPFRLLYLAEGSRPDCLEKIRQEFDSVLGGAPMTYSDVPKFEFATQIIQEALRLYPPFWMVDRMAVADDRAGDLAISAGSTVIVFVYGAHHAPKHWVNPESFDPERFAKANEKLHTPFSYLPFGAGPRGCIGGNYAMLQILMILGALLRKYDLQLTPGQTIEARPMVILRPKHGIRMTFTEASARDVGQNVGLFAHEIIRLNASHANEAARLRCYTQPQCYDDRMSLPFDAKRVREYAVEFGAGGQRLGCEFGLEDGSIVFIDDSQITPEIERIISSLGSPSAWDYGIARDEQIS